MLQLFRSEPAHNYQSPPAPANNEATELKPHPVTQYPTIQPPLLLLRWFKHINVTKRQGAAGNEWHGESRNCWPTCTTWGAVLVLAPSHSPAPMGMAAMSRMPVCVSHVCCKHAETNDHRDDYTRFESIRTRGTLGTFGARKDLSASCTTDYRDLMVHGMATKKWERWRRRAAVNTIYRICLREFGLRWAGGFSRRSDVWWTGRWT